MIRTKYNIKRNDEELLEIEIQEDEESPVGLDQIISPFNPKDIKIIVEPKTIDHLVSRIRHDEIDMNTEFQRKGNLWSFDKQSRLIESLLLRLPLPAFYFDASDDNKWLVVDGLQRLWSLKNFVANVELKNSGKPDDQPIQLTGLEILVDLNNKGITYDKLNRTMQRRILETPITTYLIQPDTPKNVKYNVFKRINSGGLGLNSMEIRNALNQERPNNGKKSPAVFLKELSENSKLKSILRLQDKRMEDRELLLRAYSFIVKDFSEYENPLSGFLDKTIETLLGKSNLELDELSDGIIDAIYFQKKLFGKHIFSRSIAEGKRIQLNSALFEVWVSETYKLTRFQKDKLLENAIALTKEYKTLFKDEVFFGAVVSSTSGKGAVTTRFSKIQNLIQKYSK
jgi:hypothetical protein